MTRPPTSALILGCAGLVPFLWGALTVLMPGFGQQAATLIGGRFVGPYVQLFYGAIILSFMSGVLWGFATKADGPRAAAGYALSTLPALWAFFMTGGGPTSAATNLAAGFAALLLLDAQFARWGLAPAWWMTLRIGLSAAVILTLLPVIF
ncbi:DUF3429 domain-containing protein [Roseisalinus antarcticus]|uniref:DUF3429 domain-containing protein n=1 Tax=Roseisalinus antarcticus TaxID=254357 RepID=A0A1Y5SP30_9RHOB|nr:DUF3429 domain-containing protein [Roseisalinus antarcticus]SLN44746.1 hypothetical protein ROA7023_01849 [Roseisalinus antarcticus]